MSETEEPKVEHVENSESPESPALFERVRSMVSIGRSKQLLEEDRGPSQEEIQELKQAIGNAYDAATIELAEDEEEAEQVSNLLVAATKKLSPRNRKVSMETYLKADKEFKKAFVLMENAKKVKRANQSPRLAVMIVALAYPILVFVLGLLPLPEKLLGLPTLVFAWGFFGGYAAVIFRHLLRVGDKWKFEFLWIWVVIRPILGAIMGAFLYLALISGVLLFSSEVNLSEIREQLILFIAFVGGFSERFWAVLINSVLGPSDRTK